MQDELDNTERLFVDLERRPGQGDGPDVTLTFAELMVGTVNVYVGGENTKSFKRLYPNAVGAWKWL